MVSMGTIPYRIPVKFQMQRRATRLILELVDFDYSHQLSRLELTSLKTREIRMNFRKIQFFLQIEFLVFGISCQNKL
ncbi:hypothetical protein BpHYR1_021471 [Brachionus plicatilis]|uniref:Uncharacterized protein n=1 Tax=Brachionus plicatilis TaxID=10195 RepID=A0A3M7PR51_BRAPC|nr:hypothetical protein BpHYR1_021471 [Brachionus plicatilis]